jgi:hypothetical protein
VSQHNFEGARWIKSSRSNTQDACVELARVAGTIGIRDSKKGDAGPILEFTPASLAAFITGTTFDH